VRRKETFRAVNRDVVVMLVVVTMGSGDAQVSIAAVGERLLVTVAVHAVHQRRSCAGAVKTFHHQTPSPASQHIRSSTISYR